MNATRDIAVEEVQAKDQARTYLERRRMIEKTAFGVLWLAAGFVIVVLFFVIFYLFIQGGKFFIGPENLMEDAVILESNVEVRSEIASTAGAVGYLPFSVVNDEVKTLSLNGVEPTTENVENGSYLVLTPLYMVSNAGRQPAAEAWLNFVTSQEAQAILAEMGFVPIQNTTSFNPTDEALSGELVIAGSTEMEPLTVALAEAFNDYYPDLAITIEGGGSSNGIRNAAKDRIDVGLTSRHVRDYELNRYDELEVFEVADDGIAVVTHPDVPVDNVTFNEARDLFSGSITNWDALGVEEKPVVVASRDTTSGLWESFHAQVMSKDNLIQHGFESGDYRMVAQGIGASLKFIGRFLTTEPRPGMGGKGGISTTIVTTVYMVGLTLAIATPLGVGAAIYLVEYAGEMGGQSNVLNKVVSVIRFAVETLAGVPSIIYGLFGFALFVTVMKLGLSMISGALAGACLILPTIIRTTEEALLTVPRSYREGSLALGSTKWQTNWRVVLPTAIPGIVTGIVLGVGRIVSETAVFYVTLGGSINFPESVMDQGRTMVLHLYSLMMDANAPDPAMGTALVIIVVIVMLNLFINYLSSRLSRSMRGGE
jgi:phosphate transport system permease protein